MRNFKSLLHPDINKNEETPKKKVKGRTLQTMLVIFVISCITILSSCEVFFRVPVEGRHDNGHRGHGERHDERH